MSQKESLKKVREDIISRLSADEKVLDNVERRALHARVELLRLDLEEELVSKRSRSVAGGNVNNSEELLSKEEQGVLDELVKRLSLVPIRRPWRWWYWLDIVYRFVGVNMGIMSAGLFLSLPLVLLRGVDALLGVDHFSSLSEQLKRSIAWGLLLLSGIETQTSGIDREGFSGSCVMLTFSHASNIDGFLVSGTCPIRHYALGKKELFFVPFFSWLSLAFGGVPVDREHRDRAVGALKRSAEAAKNGKICLAIAPEGTRSTTGQLLPFKKGTFHTWEQLHAPIVPVIIYGAYDLYPVGSWVNQCGHVAVRYLPAIMPSEATSRDDMIRIVSVLAIHICAHLQLQTPCLPPPSLSLSLSHSHKHTHSRTLTLHEYIHAYTASATYA